MKTRPPISILPVAFLAGALLACVWFGSGCSTRKITTPDGRFTYQSSRLGAKESVKELEFQLPDGSRFVMRGYAGDQVEGLVGVTEATARGVVQGFTGGSGSGASALAGPAASILIPAGQKLVQKNGSVVLVPKDDPSVPRLEIEPKP